MEEANNKTTSISELTKEQLIEKIAVLQNKLKEVIAKKNSLVSVFTIEKLNSKQYEETNANLIKENEHLKDLLGSNKLQIPQIPKNSIEPKTIERSEVSSESYEFLDLELDQNPKLKGHIIMDSITSQINKDSFLRKPDYDIKIKLNTVKDLEFGSCYIKSKLSEQDALQKTQKKYLILAAFGSKAVGKTYILSKICGTDIPIDSHEQCKSQGITIKYSKESEFGFMDIFGSHLSLEEMNLGEDVIQLEERILIKSFIEDFVMENCGAILLIVDEMTFEDEILIEKIKKKYYGKKKILVIHNFSRFTEIETVEKRITIDMKKEGKTNKNLSHVIFANEWSSAAKKYNKNGLEQLKKALLQDQDQVIKPFNMIEKFKEFFKKNSLHYQFPKGSTLDELIVNEKRVLQLKSLKNSSKTFTVLRYDGFGNIISSFSHPNYTVLNVTSNVMKIYVELPGITTYKVTLLKAMENDNEKLTILLKGLRTEIADYDEERSLEEFETKIEVPLNDLLISQRSEINGHKLEDGLLEIDLELF